MKTPRGRELGLHFMFVTEDSARAAPDCPHGCPESGLLGEPEPSLS